MCDEKEMPSPSLCITVFDDGVGDDFRDELLQQGVQLTREEIPYRIGTAGETGNHDD